MKKKVSRPLSSAASFFRKNGTTSHAHRSIPRPAVPMPSTSSAVSGLNSSPEELNHLLNSVFPLLVNFLGNEDPGLEGLFVVDPSASSQEAMMGLTDPSQREPVRALREILDARFQGGSEAAILRAHHVYVWGIALKLLLKELIAKKQPVITPVAVGMLNESAAKPDRLDFLKQRRFADFVSVPVANLFHVMQRCRTSKEKLGFVFAVLLFGSEHNVEQMSKTTQFLMTNAEEIFGTSPFPQFRSASSSGMLVGNQNSASTPMLGSTVRVAAAPPPPLPQFQLAPNKFLFTALCTFDFDPESPDELELRVGDTIEVLECIDDEWFKGRLRLPDGTVEEGLFPAAFVKRDTPVTLPPPPPSQSPMQFPPAPALFDQNPPPPPPQQQQQQLTPTTLFDSSPPPLQQAAVNESDSAMLAVALFDFVAEEEGELMLQKGERLVILDQTDPDWWLGKRVRDGVQGLFPFNYANMLSAPSSNVFTAQVPFAPSTAASSPPAAPAPITVTPVLPSAPPAMPPGPKPTATTKPATSQRGTGSSRPRPPPPPNPTNIVLPPPKASTAAAAAVPKPSPAPDIPLAIADPVANGWTITADAYQKYLGFFSDQPKDETGRRVVGRDMAQFLVQSGLPKQTIARVLELSDIDKDQRFDSDEFALAMHLALCISKRKMPLPTTLPPYLVPKTKRAV